ncbi:MAG: RNA polymerase sigma factor [bacterium]|nr:RNA polymerase sigma factor [bacterium]
MTATQETERKEVLALAHHDFEKGLNAHAYFKVSDHEVGEDLVQETFLKTWKYLVRGGKIEVMKAFLYHVLNNLIVDQYRKHKTASLDVLMEEGYEPSVDHSERLFNVLDGKRAIRLIGTLPVKYQKVMRMRYAQDLSLKEMSHITGQSQNTMAVQVHRGLAKLKLLYTPA